MRIKKYTAPSMREALLQIRDDLGENAVILRTRKLPKGLLALGSPGEIEVTAAVEESAVTKAMITPLQLNGSATYTRPTPARNESIDRMERVESARSSVDKVASTRHSDSVRVEELKEELAELRTLIKDMAKPQMVATEESEFRGGWAALHRKLVDAEVRPERATTLIQDIRARCQIEDVKVGETFMATIADRFPVSGPVKMKIDQPAFIAFVGPTGTGKTTTIAKLAAYYRLQKNKKVSLITADTYRIAAIEQIRTFADILGVKLHVLFNPDEAEVVLKSCRNDDVVFIDSAGRSQRNAEHMNDLTELLKAIKPDETHLVVSATMKHSDLEATVKTYRRFGVDRLLFTKLDETVHVGNILSTALTSDVPVSYFTTGQTVPDDIELAQPERFLRRLWEGARA